MIILVLSIVVHVIIPAAQEIETGGSRPAPAKVRPYFRNKLGMIMHA
jgi:hypothetical protein